MSFAGFICTRYGAAFTVYGICRRLPWKSCKAAVPAIKPAGEL